MSRDVNSPMGRPGSTVLWGTQLLCRVPCPGFGGIISSATVFADSSSQFTKHSCSVHLWRQRRLISTLKSRDGHSTIPEDGPTNRTTHPD